MEELSKQNQDLIEVQRLFYSFQNFAFINNERYRIKNINPNFTQQEKLLAIDEFRSINRLSITFNYNTSIYEDQAILLEQGFNHLQLLNTLTLQFEQCTKFNEIIIDRIASSFKQLKQLQTLVINAIGNNVINESMIISLGSNLKYLKQLDVLSLCFYNKNVIGLKGMSSLCDGISNLKQLSNLLIQFGKECNIGSEGFTLLGKSLSVLNNLEKVNLKIDCNSIGLEGMIGFRDQIKSQKRIRFLDIDMSSPFHLYLISLGNDFELQNETFSINSIFNILVSRGDQGLNHLDFSLGKDNIGIEGCQAIREVFRSARSLESLKIFICENKIGKDGAIELSNGLSYLNKLNKLFIDIDGGNNIEGEGAIKIVEGCASSKDQLSNLTLTFDSNNISDKGFYQFGVMLKQLASLQVLNLSLKNNQISSQGLIFIGEGISHLKQINKLLLCLSKNKIGTTGVVGLSKGLQELDLLNQFTLLLDQNEVCGVGLVALGDIVKNKNNLRLFYVNMMKNKVICLESLEDLVENLKLVNQFCQVRLEIDTPYLGILLSLINILKFSNSKQLRLNCFQEYTFQIWRDHYNHFYHELNLKICANKNYHGYSELNTLSKAIAKLTNLTKLDYKVNESELLNDDESAALGKSFMNLKKLQELKLNVGSTKEVTNVGIRNILQGLNNLDELTKLVFQADVKGQLISLNEGLTQGLIGLQNLQKLELLISIENNISLTGQLELGKTLDKLKNLHELSLKFRKNDGSECSFEVLSSLQSVINLHLLDIELEEKCFLNLDSQFESLKNIEGLKLKIIKSKCDHNVTHITLSQSEISERMVNVISKLNKIKQLELDGDIFQSESLGQSLKDFPSLNKFSLTVMSLSFYERKNMAKWIQSLENIKQIQQLSLSISSFHIKDLVLLFDLLLRFSFLTNLSIQTLNPVYISLSESLQLLPYLKEFIKSAQNLKTIEFKDLVNVFPRISQVYFKGKRLVSLNIH